MSLSDPFESTEQTAYQGRMAGQEAAMGGVGAIGDTMKTLGLMKYEKAQKQQEFHQKLMGDIVSSMVSNGQLTLDKNLAPEIMAELGIKGFNTGDPLATYKLLKDSNAFQHADIEYNPNMTIKSIKMKSQDEIDKISQDVKKSQEEMAIKQQELQTKQEEVKAASAKQAGQGLPFFGLFPSPQKKEYEQIQEQLRQQLLNKSKNIPKYDPSTQKLQRNTKTGEYRVVPLGE